MAYNAGLGFIGKNGFLINSKWGTYIFLAHIITDCIFEYDMPMNKKCKECGECIKHCPTGALTAAGYESEKCLSYITQKKSPLSDFEEKAIKQTGMCWGCDICQNVCPHNINVPKTDIPEFNRDLIVNLKLPECSNREFKKIYSDRAFSWRGKGIIERNLKIINNITDKK